MQRTELLELHYYLKGDSHAIDAFVRNKCETHVLAIAKEILIFLNEENISILNEIPTKGGFREFFKFINTHKTELAIISGFSSPFVALLAVLLSRTPALHPEQIKNLQFDDTLKQLNIEKLRKEIYKPGEITKIGPDSAFEKSIEFLDSNFKVLKNKSNLYQTLQSYPDVEKISTTTYVDTRIVMKERVVDRANFHKFILTTNQLKPSQVDNAIIEIISPVITKEGKYKWKGIYEGKPISFNMKDEDFKANVMSGKTNFHGEFYIQCVLIIGREINEAGLVEDVGYSVATVLGEVKDNKIIETEKGKKYRRAKEELTKQHTLWDLKQEEEGS